jgi:hypothetical protein
MVEMNDGWQEEVSRMAFEAMSKRLQPVLDQILEEHGGQPAETIKPVIAERWAAANEGASITDPELTNVAETISRGERVVLTQG